MAFKFLKFGGRSFGAMNSFGNMTTQKNETNETISKTPETEKKNIVYIQPSQDWIDKNVVSGLPKGSWSPDEYVKTDTGNIVKKTELADVTIEQQTPTAPPSESPPPQENERVIAPWERIGDPRLMPKETQGKSEYKPYSDWIKQNITKIKREESAKGNEVLNPAEAYAKGVISYEEKKLREQRGEFITAPFGTSEKVQNINKEIEQRYPGIVASGSETLVEKANKIEKRKELISAKLATNPVIQASYVLSPFRSFDVVAEAGVSILSQKPKKINADFSRKINKNLMGYSRGIIENPELFKVEDPAKSSIEVGILASSVLSGPAGLFAGGVGGAMYGTALLTQSYSYATAKPEKKGEEAARLFVYSTPIIAGLAGKIKPSYSVTVTPFYYKPKTETRGFGLDSTKEIIPGKKANVEDISIVADKRVNFGKLTAPEKKPLLSGSVPFYFRDDIVKSILENTRVKSVDLVTLPSKSSINAKFKPFDAEIKTSKGLMLKQRTRLKIDQKQENMKVINLDDVLKPKMSEKSAELSLSSSRFDNMVESLTGQFKNAKQKSTQKRAELSLSSSRFDNMVESLTGQRSKTKNVFEDFMIGRRKKGEEPIPKIGFGSYSDSKNKFYQEFKTGGRGGLGGSIITDKPVVPVGGFGALPNISGFGKGSRSLIRGRKNAYNPSLFGLVSGRSIKTAPIGSLSGLEVRYPVLKFNGGRRK